MGIYERLFKAASLVLSILVGCYQDSVNSLRKRIVSLFYLQEHEKTTDSPASIKLLSRRA